MTENEVIKVIETEKQCVLRNGKNECDRDCICCDLVMAENDIVCSYDIAIKTLEENQQYRAIGTVEEFKNCMDILNKAEADELAKIIDEWLLYQKIGTVEECREARERQLGKKVNNRTLLRDFNGIPYSVRGDCPNCESKGLLSRNTNYCNACGYKLDWSE